MRTPDELARVVDSFEVRVKGMVRRAVVSLTKKASVIWQLTGFRQLDGSVETFNAELFGGIGVHARPPAGGKPEAIALMVGEARHPAIVAVRDEATRSAHVNDLSADETCIYNGAARVYVKADGTVEIRLHAGVVEPMLKGNTYRTAEDTMLTLLSTLATALADLTKPGGVAPHPGSTAAAAALATGITAFKAAAATYLTTVLKGQ